MNTIINKYIKGDRIIWIVIVMLSIFSLLAVYSSTGTLAFAKRDGNIAYYVFKHSSILIVGMLIIFVTHHINYKFYQQLSLLFLIISIPLLALTLFLGTRYNDANRWLTLPVIGLTFQTSDFAKLALIMYVARILSYKQSSIKNFKSGFLPVFLPVIAICGLILPANFSTAAILFFTSVMLMFIGRVSFKYIVSFTSAGVLFLVLFLFIAMSINKEGRINTWKNRVESFTSGDTVEDYQVQQAKIAIATGGLLGKKPGRSTQRNFLPHPYSDFIFAIIVEEYGLVGAVFILFLYLYLLFRAGTIIRKCNRAFPAFLAIGLTLLIVFQAMINMAVAVNLLPVTGQTLPLVSMGGTSLLFTCVALGIILSVSRENKMRLDGGKV